MSKIWKVLQWVIVVVLMIVGLALIFNEQIKSYVVNHMSQTAISKPVDTKTKQGIHFLVWIEIPCQIFLYKKEDICCPLVIQSIHHKNHERRLNKCPIMILS